MYKMICQDCRIVTRCSNFDTVMDYCRIPRTNKFLWICSHCLTSNGTYVDLANLIARVEKDIAKQEKKKKRQRKTRYEVVQSYRKNGHKRIR